MARPVSEHVQQVRSKLVQRLQNGFYHPGDRFMSNRAVAKQFGVSYQTAQRLITALCEEGLLYRKAQSGTYVPGERPQIHGVDLLFNARSERPGSFGDRLSSRLLQRLAQNNIDCQRFFVSASVGARPSRLPVIWESPHLVASCAEHQVPAMLINDSPPPGLHSLFIDSVRCDDYSGGAAAAQILHDAGGSSPAILAGPENDSRSRLRVAGFQSVLNAPVHYAGSWFYEDAYRHAEQVLRSEPGRLFCCNDRLAQGIIDYCRDKGRRPPIIVGFDDAPVAERLDITTIAIPWDEMVEAACNIIRRRLEGDRAAAHHVLITPRPVIRRLA